MLEYFYISSMHSSRSVFRLPLIFCLFCVFPYFFSYCMMKSSILISFELFWAGMVYQIFSNSPEIRQPTFPSLFMFNQVTLKLHDFSIKD